MSSLRRAGRRTNVALLALLVGALATGLLAFGVGAPTAARVVAVAHGAFGLGLLLLVPWKSVIVRRGLTRAARSGHTVGLVLGLLVVTAVGAGVVHAAAGYSPVLGFTALTVHVAAAVLVVPFLLVHARGRRQVPRRVDLSRRAVVRAGTLGLGSLAAYAAVETVVSALDLPGRDRRATGSFDRGTDVPAQMPVTQWFTDTVPEIDDRDAWQVDVGLRQVSYEELASGSDVMRAVLDCTGGWYAEQEWRGMRVDRLLDQVQGPSRSLDVVSVTGYRRRLPLDGLDRLLLATHAAGAPLSAGHGGPVRLVAPFRRGFWWVKWVERIELTAEPWWWQPPFPLQ